MSILARAIASGSAAVFLIASSWAYPLAAELPEPQPEAERSKSEYQRWVDRYARPTLAGHSIDGVPTRLRLVVTAVTGDGSKNVEEEGAFPFESGIRIFGNEVSNDGHVRYFSHTDFGSKGGGGGDPIPAADLARLSKLLEKLPDDESRLPPADRRMIVQADEGRTRVYDRAEAPDIVWETLRLGRCGIGSWVPTFKTQSEINASRHQHGGFLCLSPDGRQILFTSSKGPLQFWEPATHEFVAEIATRDSYGDEIVFSPNGDLAAIAGFGTCVVMETRAWHEARRFSEPVVNGKRPALFAPQFLRNGRYLLLHCSDPSLRIVDVQSWERVDRLPEVPENALQYLPSRSGRRALVRSSAGDVLLWDMVKNHEIAKLDRETYVARASFALGEPLVAAVTAQRFVDGHGQTNCRVRIWNADTGEAVHELMPFEHSSLEQVEGLAWTQDGRYVLVVTKSDSFYTSRGVSVFNVESGRHRGEFEGCPGFVKGIAILPERGQLVAGCVDGQIRFWDLNAGLEQIAAFEKSIAPRHATTDASRR